MFKITEFATITGLTIRTLQYYDEIGLLVPHREKNGHRVYSYKDLIIINEVILLKNMSFSLDEITEYINSSKQVDLKKSLIRQKKILKSRVEEINKQILNLEWLIEVDNKSEVLEETAIRRVFIDNNPLKEHMSSIWSFDFEDSKTLSYLKQYEGTLNFDTCFKRISKLQEYNIYDKRVQEEISKFVDNLQDSYKGSFNLDNISQFTSLYIDNKEARNYLKQYGEHFNEFLVDALTYFSQTKNR
ncbi:MerR family transcriptional regulator [Globicatella sulfidifaciens]